MLHSSRSFPAALLWFSLAMGSASGIRLAMSPWVVGLPFVTFFPAVLFVAVFLGWRWGVAGLIWSAMLANLLFEGAFPRWSLVPHDVVGTVAFLMAGGLVVLTAETLRTAVRQLADQSRQLEDLNAELQHRVKNTLAVAQGLSHQTARTARDPKEFHEAFGGRLVALGEAHNVLSSGGWDECRLPELARAALKPFAQTKAAITIEGPQCAIPVASCVPLVLALHELATNAVKYGSLSVPSGHVSLKWGLREGTVVLRWQERGGPPVKKPTRKGLGSRLLMKQSGIDDVAHEYAPEGVSWEASIKGARLVA